MYKLWLSSLLLVISLLSFNTNKEVKPTILLGKVVGIMDGDTFKLLTKDSTVVKVRLANIDCPEKKQSFSTKAKDFVSEAIFNKHVTVQVLKKDRYRRLIANVFYGDSINLNHQLVKKGLAWHYVKYSKDTILQSLEDNAKKDKVGLWQDLNAISPWQWRDNKKEAYRLKKLNKNKG
ncbi:thermonuclease family protein [uncultured Lacinutrix sp.]|uniref:thermonuclease family protein n=1 Tax=uncultured Lacinutrix sp. TaxID=574032 RepID=UPI0026308D6C|nr:thermonuclease family protein [uncultured Lacinutrix sp.]